ncbi:MAG: DNA-directed RNA polymerase subunit L [Nanoarchaeota archaeon]|nr:DNA-directed RNA polymerase subunit L [Nanoarchaeota archaeon]
MEIKILDESKEKIEFEIDGEDHTLCNALRDALWKNPNVEVAAYSVDHPLINKVKMVVAVSKGNPRDALLKAVEIIKKEFKMIGAEFSKVV